MRLHKCRNRKNTCSFLFVDPTSELLDLSVNLEITAKIQESRMRPWEEAGRKTSRKVCFIIHVLHTIRVQGISLNGARILYEQSQIYSVCFFKILFCVCVHVCTWVYKVEIAVTKYSYEKFNREFHQ